MTWIQKLFAYFYYIDIILCKLRFSKDTLKAVYILQTTMHKLSFKSTQYLNVMSNSLHYIVGKECMMNIYKKKAVHTTIAVCDWGLVCVTMNECAVKTSIMWTYPRSKHCDLYYWQQSRIWVILSQCPYVINM